MSTISQSNPNTPSITVVNTDGSVTLLPGSPLGPYSGYPVLRTQFAKDGYSRKNLDNTIVNETDAGYESTRPRNTAFKKRDYTLGYSMMPDTELAILRNFFEQVGNCAGIFTFVDPTSNELLLCRFTDTATENYAGFSSTPPLIGHLWNVTYKLRSLKLISQTYQGYIAGVPTGPISNGSYSQVLLSQNVVFAVSGLFVFLNGALQGHNDTTLSADGSKLTFTSQRVMHDDNVIILAYALSGTTVLHPAITLTGVSFNQLMLNPPCPAASYEIGLFVNGVSQNDEDFSQASDGASLTTTFSINVNDEIEVYGYARPALCTISGARDNINSTFGISPSAKSMTLVFMDGLLADPGSYTLSGATLVMHVAPPVAVRLKVYTW